MTLPIHAVFLPYMPVYVLRQLPQIVMTAGVADPEIIIGAGRMTVGLSLRRYSLIT